MNNGEFYRSNEYNATSEYQHFPAEAYVPLQEENGCGKELADLGKETTTLQPKPREIPKSGGTKTLIDKIFGSVRSVATAATVAVTSMVVTTTLITGAPEAELVSLECGDTHVEYQMEISGLQEDSAYAIVVSTSNEDDRVVEITGDGTYHNRIEGLKPDWEYTLSLVCYDTALGDVSYFEVKFQTLKHNDQQPLPPPESEPQLVSQVTVTEACIVGLNEIRIYFTHRNLPANGTVEFDLRYGEWSVGKVVATAKDVKNGYVTVCVESAAVLTVAPTVVVKDGDNEVKTTCESYEVAFEDTLAVQAMVGLYSETVTFYPIGLTNGAEYLCVTSSVAPDAPELLSVEGAVSTWYTAIGEITYTLDLTNTEGDVLSNEVSITVDTSVEVPTPDYHFVCLNPGDVGVTYNDDGTVNLYIQTQFESDNEDVYYRITVGDICYVSRDRIAVLEGLPDQSYALRYDVCVDMNGMPYSIFHETPSGMANEPYLYLNGSLTDNVLHLQLYREAFYLDLNSVVLISESGEQIALSEVDFAYNEEYGTYDVVARFDQAPAYVTVRMMGNPYRDGLDGIDGYLGNIRKLLEATVYQP